MGDLRSNTYRDNRMQIEPYSGAGRFGGGGGGRPTVFNQESRSYSASYATYLETQPPVSVKELKKGKSTNGSSSKGWGLNDPEFQRKRRVASYKAYSVEGKMKGSFRKSFRWFKDSYEQL
ncbi:hypothetical protein V2J09_012379 [Rumex salicifolius]